MIRIDRVTTRGGDGGETSLGDGTRVAKDSLRIEAIGAVDEANAALGVLRLHAGHAHEALIASLQNDLFDVGADLCLPGTGGDRLRVTAAQVERLDRVVAELTARLSPLTSFVLPGGSTGAAQAHVARTVARRAERAVVALVRHEDATTTVVAYLNRLSDVLFALGRVLNDDGKSDVTWVPGGADRAATGDST